MKLEPVTLGNIDEGGYSEGYLGDNIRARMTRDKKRLWAGDNISEYIHDGDKEQLINEATEAC